ncbi:uncharacterized protein TRIVIDRAFT_33120 [Trichoderma virens Gv29-8]|uniref:Ca2+-dependent lipid-binding protein n=1 Tax=Hypocrea virens (strain Gv29-8 / FGSC 10586) TaxID=413071 RepID=G9MIM7_HYPVG|nr:uncharacterized protein TRIVIDRAFT_33120 [Trichoderma virens Gv29-8]EHK25344.1 hypothetical protein TRIVIDRAFT_33120 [Trichoderma virens Gv29-8]
MAGKEDVEHARRYEAPYSERHPIPTISKYREEKEARQQNALRNNAETPDQRPSQTKEGEAWDHHGEAEDSRSESEAPIQDTSQVDPAAFNPRKHKKDSKKERAEREVTDPVTHLPVKIHDFTDNALKELDVNEDPFEQAKRTLSGIDEKNKSDAELRKEQDRSQGRHDALMNQFPPPDLDFLRKEVHAASTRGFLISLTGACGILVATCVIREVLLTDAQQDGGWVAAAQRLLPWLALIIASAGAFCVFIFGVRDWTTKKVDNAIQDEIWRSQRRQMKHETRKYERETTLWLNSLLSSVWPLINPDLFTSLADTLEDVMQASLPKLIRMVSVEDIGQGSESLRILGVRWLPTGAAAQAVTEDGKIISHKDDESRNSTDPDGGEEPDNQTDKSASRGMAAEEGDFINLEVAFAYRTRSTSKSFKERSKDMHLYLAFYLPGNLKIPVWVDLQGAVGTMRLRLQLTPDPPFFDLCTLTLLGQPKVDLSCVPLNKHALNIMDVPFISNFVQSAVDAAMAQYVAPKSLTLDLKDMLAGDDFKKDTYAKGVLMINIKRGYDFKMGDSGIPLIKDSGSDPYVSVGWAKFGKVLWSTRILLAEMEPYWDETCFVLVTPEELNINERLRIQLWDSDRFTADDDLGRIEVDLKELMQNENSNGRMWQRTDGFKALKFGDNMPGKLEWSVGYFSKARIQKCQFDQQTHDPEVRSMDQLKEKVSNSCERKLREAMLKHASSDRDESEMEQQKMQEMKAEQDAMIISAPPPDGYPSGIFSLQIHNITGLEVPHLSKSLKDKDGNASDEETGEGLPSAYCTVIVNHKKTYKTRTKPQNTKPFFNAICERFIRDWRSCEVYVSVRDARLHEDDPLLGIVHLPLSEVFKDRSQRNGFWPISGGIGYGKIRLSMVWRSVQLQAPRNLVGWQYGTVNVQPVATSLDCPQDLRYAKLKLKTDISSGKMYSRGSGEATWVTSKERPLNLAVQKRYSGCLSIAFKDKKVLGDKVSAFSVCWLKDIPDEEELTLDLPIWKGNFKRATSCCLEQCGEKIGTLSIKITFWQGMGAAHSEWANNSEHIRDVVEVIDAARDNLRDDEMERAAGIVDEEISSDSDSSDEHEYIPDGSADHKQGPLDQLRDYKRRDKSLHRQHRGLMQWKSDNYPGDFCDPRAKPNGSG